MIFPYKMLQRIYKFSAPIEDYDKFPDYLLQIATEFFYLDNTQIENIITETYHL